MNLYLVDNDAWASVGIVASAIPNNGTHTWILPTSLPCNRYYRFYVENVQRTQWSYGPLFQLKCDIKILKQRAGPNYTITITNGAFPISSLVSPTPLQHANIPEFWVTDTLPVGLGVTNPAFGTGTGPGTWSPFTPTNGRGSFTLKYRLPNNVQTNIAPNATIATYSMKAIAPMNCATEALYVLWSGTVIPWQDSNPANNTSICQ